MIRFKCIYCGQKILAPDNGANKKGKCPKCAHLLTVPESTKGRPAISPDKEPMPDRPKPRIPEWAKESGGFDGDDARDAWTELFKESFGFLVPAYDALSFFLMAATLTLLYMTNIKMRNHLHAWMNEDWSQILPPSQYSGIEMTVFFLIFNLGFLLSIVLLYRIFKKRGDPDFVQNIMMVLAVLTNAVTGIIAGGYIVGTASYFNWLIIFPIWNIINCVLLLLMLFFNLINEDCIVESKITLFRVVLSLTLIFIIFIFCNYVFKLYWAITFSICMVYMTSFDRALQNVLPGLYRKEYTTREEIKI